MRITPKGTFRPLLLFLSIGALLFGFVLADRRGELYELRRSQAEELLELRGLERKRNVLLDERERLLTDPGAIERVARDQYGLVAPGENVGPARDEHPKARQPGTVSVESDGWDWIFGRGEYPWQIPGLVLLGGAVILGVLELPSLLHRVTQQRGS